MLGCAQVERILDFKEIKLEKTTEEQQIIRQEKFLSDFERFLKYQKRYSDGNISTTMYRVKRIVKHYNIIKPTVEDAIKIEEAQRELGNGNKTIIHFLEALTLMAEFNGDKLKLKRPKLIVREPDYLKADELRALLDAATNKRDKALIAVLCCSLRNKEVRSLYCEDVDLKNRFLWIRDRGQGIKNRHERKAIMSVECAKILKDWLDVRPIVMGNNFLFITAYGKPFSVERINRIVKSTARQAGLKKNVYAHLLRHSIASTMLKSGIPLTEVALQLGHKSPMTTVQIYLHGNYDDLKSSIDKTLIF